MHEAQRKLRHKWRKRRIKELHRQCDDMLYELMLPTWKKEQLEWLHEEKERLEKVVEEQRLRRAQSASGPPGKAPCRPIEQSSRPSTSA